MLYISGGVTQIMLYISLGAALHALYLRGRDYISERDTVLQIMLYLFGSVEQTILYTCGGRGADHSLYLRVRDAVRALHLRGSDPALHLRVRNADRAVHQR